MELKHIKDCHLGENWRDCPACLETHIPESKPEQTTRQQGHSVLRVNKGKLEKFDPHPQKADPIVVSVSKTLSEAGVKAAEAVGLDVHYVDGFYYASGYEKADILANEARGAYKAECKSHARTVALWKKSDNDRNRLLQTVKDIVRTLDAMDPCPDEILDELCAHCQNVICEIEAPKT